MWNDRSHRSRSDRSERTERAESSRHPRKRRQEDEEIIKVPLFDYTDLVEKYKLSLVGRMFHQDGRSVDALINHMPKRRIWDVEGRVRGTNLGNNKFQFDFDREEDLQKVLLRRPCHFNKWSFSLERWIPTIKEDFPNSMLLWVTVKGIPTHYKKDESYRSAGKALGKVEKVDVDNGRVRVIINMDEPLQFERKLGYSNGDVIRVTLTYEELHRYCYTCKRVSHEEGTCPDLTPEQREANRIARLDRKEKEEVAAREAFSAPLRGFEGKPRFEKQERALPYPDMARKRTELPIREDERQRTDRLERSRNEDHEDLRNMISYNREIQGKKVWNRLEYSSAGRKTRELGKYHPYRRQERDDYQTMRRDSESLIKSKHGDSNSSSSWRVKGRSSQYRDRNEEQREDKRKEHSPKSYRASSDSQRTISENLRDQRGTGPARGREAIGQLDQRLSWQPVRSSGRNPEEISRPLIEQQVRRTTPEETEEERRRRIKGKAVMVNEGAKETFGNTAVAPKGSIQISEPRIPTIPDNQEYTERRKDKEETITARKTLPQASAHTTEAPTHENIMTIPMGDTDKQRREEKTSMEQDGEEDLQLPSEEELRIFEEQYASVNFEMDEEMIDEDDLLDEPDLDHEIVPETQEVTQLKKTGKTTQDERAGGEPGIEKTKKSESKERRESEQMKKNQRDKSLAPLATRRRGTRSPDAKGIAASKKLAARGRASPKSKSIKHSRTSATTGVRSNMFPPTEVFPAAKKSRKLSTVLGSVGSQKPPSPQI